MNNNDSSKPSGDSKSEEQNKSGRSAEEIAEEIRAAENSENPEWDGSEAEFVRDDDAEEYEIPETGIRLSYVLTFEEVYSCLYHSNMFKTKGARAIFDSVILIMASVVFFVIYFTSKSQYTEYNLFFGIICIVMTAAIWIVPHLHMKSMAKILCDGKEIETEIYPTHIDIGRDDGAWSIELDGKSRIEEFDNIFLIYADGDRTFAIPQRVIEPELYNEIRAILMSGTEPAED